MVYSDLESREDGTDRNGMEKEGCDSICEELTTRINSEWKIKFVALKIKP